jgi:peptidoglycan/xylan/chitin deacetylase (PgdA/CDA1 family)
MMTTAQLKTLHAADMEIGGHTHRHPILAKLDNVAARAEIEAGRAWLQDTLGDRVRLFAYPNGKPRVDYRPEQADLVRDLGFEGTVSTQYGISTTKTDSFQLPRFTPWTSRVSGFALRMLNNMRGHNA